MDKFIYIRWYQTDIQNRCDLAKYGLYLRVKHVLDKIDKNGGLLIGFELSGYNIILYHFIPSSNKPTEQTVVHFYFNKHDKEILYNHGQNEGNLH